MGRCVRWLVSSAVAGYSILTDECERDGFLGIRSHPSSYPPLAVSWVGGSTSSNREKAGHRGIGQPGVLHSIELLAAARRGLARESLRSLPRSGLLADDQPARHV